MQPCTVADVVGLYLRHCAVEQLHGEYARHGRARALREFSAAHGTLLAAECRPYHLTEWIESHPGWKSVSTRRLKANCVRACFNWAATIERIERNPFANVRYAEAERRAELTDDVLQRLIEASGHRFAAALRFLRLTGCRLGELCSATWPEMDLARGEWTIQRHKTRRFTGKPKRVALVPDAIALLESLAWVNGTAGPVFLNEAGTAWNRRTLGQQFRRTKKRAGIETAASLHGIRHRAISAMIAAGAPLKLVAEQAGHNSTAITERYYWHRTDAQLESIRDAVKLGLPKE